MADATPVAILARTLASKSAITTLRKDLNRREKEPIEIHR